MTIWIIVCVFLTISRAQDSDSLCKSHESSKSCQYGQYPSASATRHFKSSPLCCTNNGFIFKDSCPTRNQTFNTYACGFPTQGAEPTRMATKLTCPQVPLCNLFNVVNSEYSLDTFNVTNDKRMIIRNSVDPRMGNFANVTDYCVSYICDHYDGWLQGARACVCYGSDYVRFVDSKLDSELRRCCPTGYIAQPTFDGYDKIDCVSLSSKETDGQQCQNGKFTSFDLRFDKFTVKDGKLTLAQFGRPELQVDVNSTSYCVAHRFNTQDNPSETLISTIEYCKVPCDGNTPCLRTCGHDFSPNSSYLESHGLSSNNLHVMQYRPCPEGYKRTLLNPHERCMDQFTLKFSKEEVILNHWEVKLESKDFCVLSNNSQLKVEFCKKQTVASRSISLTFYPYILLSSSALLFITVLVYTFWSRLLNHSTRLVRHFALNRALSFLLLAINQLIFFKDHGKGLCITFAYLIHYFSLSSYALMTVIGVETLYAISHQTQRAEKRRYAVELSFGYSLPLAISVAMLMVDLFAERCASFRPKFAEERCFFSPTNPAEAQATFIWWLVPIILVVATNSAILLKIAHGFFVTKRQGRAMGLEETSSAASQNVMFLKLIMILGIFLIFEVIGYLVDEVHEAVWYVFDIINMSQGVFVFVIFVLKKEVFNAIMDGTMGKCLSSWTGKAMQAITRKTDGNSVTEFEMNEQSIDETTKSN